MNTPYKKIVVVGPYHPDSFAKCITETLREMGHEAHSVSTREILGVSYKSGIEKKGKAKASTRFKLRIIETLMQAKPSFEQRIYTKVEKKIVQHEPDLVLILNGRIPPETVNAVKEKTGAPVILWFPDHPANLGRQYLFGADYDAYFFKDKFLVEMARRIGKNAHYLPECCMPEWHNKIDPTDEEKETYTCDITTAGNLYHYRARIFEALAGTYDVKIWGPPVPRWMETSLQTVHQGRGVTEHDKAKAFRGAKIVVNTFQGEVDGVNLRTFEAAGCGAFQICEHRDALKELFEIDTEIVTFRNIQDLIKKVDHYLAHPEERKKIADAGYARAHRDHTYKKRLEKILETICHKQPHNTR